MTLIVFCLLGLAFFDRHWGDGAAAADVELTGAMIVWAIMLFRNEWRERR